MNVETSFAKANVLTQTSVDAMREMVHAIDSSKDEASMEQLHTLVEDTQNLQQSLAALNPINYLKFQAANLAGEDIARPGAEHWAFVLVHAL